MNEENKPENLTAEERKALEEDYYKGDFRTCARLDTKAAGGT